MEKTKAIYELLELDKPGKNGIHSDKTGTVRDTSAMNVINRDEKKPERKKLKNNHSKCVIEMHDFIIGLKSDFEPITL